jgi:PAS domain S-box-containing protein
MSSKESESLQAPVATDAAFRTLFRLAPDAILVVSSQGTVVEANEQAERAFRTERRDLVGTQLETLLPRSAREAHAKHRARYHSQPVVRRMGAGLDLAGLRRDGTEFPADVSLGPIEFNGNQAVLCIVRDMTERRRLEAQLREAEQRLAQLQKLDAIGRLAGGVGHDFNNMLSVILGYSSMMLDQLSPADPMREDVDAIRIAAERAGELTRQLLAFGRRQMLDPRVLDLNAVLLAMEPFLRHLLGENIELALVPGTGLGTALLDPVQIEHIILDLVAHSRDAMPKGGRLTIETGNADLDEDYAFEHAVAPGPYVMLAVSNTGTALSADERQRIFEPFFTTRGQGHGTGLGLATVFGIVQQSSGSICVYSEPEHGTTIKAYFPRIDKPATTAPQASAPLEERLLGNETILLVEDQEAVRTVVETILRRRGYQVLSAHSGGDALLLSEQYPDTIHLLLTDVIMPRMNGRELATRLHAQRPGMRIVYMSGYTDNAIVHDGILERDVDFIQKPIRPQKLLQRIRQVLDRTG